MRRFTILLLVAALSLAGIAIAQGSGSEDVTLCAEKKGGDLDLGAKGKCGKGEKKLTIAKVGPQGEQGPAGEDGTPADLAPEPVRYLTPANADCETQPGSFCFSSGGPSWLNRQNGYARVGFQKDSGGYVHLQGVISQGGSGAYFGDVAFYLPPGYRPTDGIHVFGVKSTDGGLANRVEINADGSVFINDACCASLDGIVFHP